VALAVLDAHPTILRGSDLDDYSIAVIRVSDLTVVYQETGNERNIEILRRRIEAWNRRDFDTVVLGYHPRIERYDFRAGAGAPFVYYGPEGSIKAFEELIEAFDELQLHPEEFLEFGDRVLMVVRVTGRARLGNMAFTERHAEIFTFDEDGLTTRLEVHRDKEAALAVLEREGVDVSEARA
jgi:ketosteroid isomerase-like protein